MTKRLIATFAFALFARTVSAQEVGPWTQFRGPDGLGISKEKNLPVKWSQQDNLAWKIELPGAGASVPILVGDKIYLTCYSGYNVPGKPAGRQEDLKLHLVCLQQSDGKILWTKDVEPKLPEQARIRESHGYASATPAADRDRIYAFFGKSGLVAFDHDGRELWRADAGDKLNGWGSAASPVLYKDLVIVNASVESESLIAFDKVKGTEKWRAKGMRESWNTPILVPVEGGKTELVVAIMGKVLGLNPDSGEQLWSCATDIGWYMVPSLVAHDGVVYCIGGRSGIAALAVKAGGSGDVTRTHRLWTSKKGSNVPSPLFHDGHLYYVNDALGAALCANAKTGEIVYDERLDGGDGFYSSPALADGKIFYVSRSGKTFVLPAAPKFEVLATNDLRDRSTFNAGPAIGPGRLYLRSDRYLYAIGK